MGRCYVEMVSEPRIGVVFPGQGSQSVGMGTDIAAESSQAADLFEAASAILGYDLLELQRNGPETKLRETQFSQPAIFTTNCALRAAVGKLLRPVVSAGHSFGEFCSLTISNALSFESALRIVNERGAAMQEAAQSVQGGMSAIIGLEEQCIRATSERIAAQTGLCVQLANFNSPSQIVVSGHLCAVQSAGEALLEAGAKRVVPLNVSGAWHSALMQPAVARFQAAIDVAEFKMPDFAVISNVDAQPYEDTAAMKVNLVRSITQEVLWDATSRRMLDYSLDLVVEFGANPVLAPLLKRFPDAPAVMNVTDARGVQKLQQRIGELAAA